MIVPSLGLTCFVRASESLEEVVAAEAARVVAARELTPAEYLGLLPGSSLTVEQLELSVGFEHGDGRGESSLRTRAARAARVDAHELLLSSGRKLPREVARARPLVERPLELQLLSSLLEGKERQSVLLVRDEGAGKSALGEAKNREILDLLHPGRFQPRGRSC